MKFLSNWEGQVNFLWRFTLVYAFMFLLYILNISAIYYPFSSFFKPPLIIMLIYYWSVFRPTLLPYWLVFAAGVLMDVASGTTLGVHAFIFVSMRWLVSDQRRFLMGQPFLMIWSGFVLVIAASGFMEWIVSSLLTQHIFSFKPLFYYVVLGVMIFPIVVVMLQFTHKLLPSINTKLVS